MKPEMEATLKLAKTGMPPVQIAEVLGVAPNTVSCRLLRLRKRGHDLPINRSGQKYNVRFCAVRVDPRVISKLQGPAQKRGMNARDLAALILETVTSEDLINATLDDAEDIADGR